MSRPEDCFECKHCDDYRLNPGKSDIHWYCYARSTHGRRLPTYLGTPPSWCPLPDAPEDQLTAEAQDMGLYKCPAEAEQEARIRERDDD